MIYPPTSPNSNSRNSRMTSEFSAHGNNQGMLKKLNKYAGMALSVERAQLAMSEYAS